MFIFENLFQRGTALVSYSSRRSSSVSSVALLLPSGGKKRNLATQLVGEEEESVQCQNFADATSGTSTERQKSKIKDEKTITQIHTHTTQWHFWSSKYCFVNTVSRLHGRKPLRTVRSRIRLFTLVKKKNSEINPESVLSDHLRMCLQAFVVCRSRSLQPNPVF